MGLKLFADNFLVFIKKFDWRQQGISLWIQIHIKKYTSLNKLTSISFSKFMKMLL